jgi:hypothetical protein
VVVRVCEADRAKVQPDRSLTPYTPTSLGHANKDREREDRSDTTDPDLCRKATEYTNNHEYKDATEITLHFINIKELKFVYRQNRNKLARALVAYL